MMRRLLFLSLSALQHLFLCAITQSEPYLLFSTWFTVSRMSLNGSDYSVLVDSSNNVGPQAVDYHLRLKLLFWSHYRDGSINQANLNGSNPTVLVSNVTRPSGLAVDWINDRIYFSFGDYGSNLVNPNHLAMYDLDNGVVTEITSAIALVYKKFRDLAVDAIGEKLYWTTGSSLVRSSLSGENVEVLFNPLCHTQYLGLTNTDLYWICGEVLSLNLTSRQVTVIPTGNTSTFYADVTAYEDMVYWTSLGRVYSAPVTGDEGVTELLHIPSIVTNFRGIVIVVNDEGRPTEVTTEVTTDVSTEGPSSNSTTVVPLAAGLTVSITTPASLPSDSSPTSLTSTPSVTVSQMQSDEGRPTEVTTDVSTEGPSSNSTTVVPLAAGLTVSITTLTLSLVLISLGVAFGVRRSKKKRRHGEQSSKDVDIQTSLNVLYEVSATLQPTGTEPDSGQTLTSAKLEMDLQENDAYGTLPVQDDLPEYEEVAEIFNSQPQAV